VPCVDGRTLSDADDGLRLIESEVWCGSPTFRLHLFHVNDTEFDVNQSGVWGVVTC
jgi:hypothetical protein